MDAQDEQDNLIFILFIHVQLGVQLGHVAAPPLPEDRIEISKD